MSPYHLHTIKGRLSPLGHNDTRPLPFSSQSPRAKLHNSSHVTLRFATSSIHIHSHQDFCRVRKPTRSIRVPITQASVATWRTTPKTIVKATLTHLPHLLVLRPRNPCMGSRSRVHKHNSCHRPGQRLKPAEERHQGLQLLQRSSPRVIEFDHDGHLNIYDFDASILHSSNTLSSSFKY